jgi:hypothetical protein
MWRALSDSLYLIQSADVLVDEYQHPTVQPDARGLHSFTLELNLSNSRTDSWVKLGYTVGRTAQVELKPERAEAPAGCPPTPRPPA